MTRIKTTAHINRPIETVYDYVTTPANWPKWHPSSLAVAGDAAHSLQIGESVTEHFRVAGREGSVVWTVSERQRPTLWRIDGRIVGADAGGSVTYMLTAIHDETHFEREFAYEATTWLYKLLDELIVRRRIRAESEEATRRLKAVLEQ